MEDLAIHLKNGREVMLRLLRSDDKDKLLSMFSNMSENALLWSSPPYDEQKIDRWMGGSESGLSLVALSKEQLVGISAVSQFPRPRQIGIGEMIIYIHQDFHGVGLRTEMISTLLALARHKGLHRIGLKVVENNEAAVRLYKKFGFEIEGVLKDAYFGADGKYYNELVMGILFPQN